VDETNELLQEIAEHLNVIRVHTLVAAIAGGIVLLGFLLTAALVVLGLAGGFAEGFFG